MRCLLLFLFLSSCHPAYAKTFPYQWDGTCIPISEKEDDKYHQQNPDTVSPYQKGYIPPDIPDDGSDIITCLPHTMGPK